MILRSVYLTMVGGANELVYKIGGGEGYLLGINLQEKDSSDQTQYDAASIWLQDPQGQNSISLANGWAEGGELSAWGCIPVVAGQEIHAKWWHARAGYIGSLHIYLMPVLSYMKQGGNILSAEGISLPSTFTWQQKQTTQPVFPAGKLKVLALQSAENVQQYDVRPDDGFMWQVIWLAAYQNSGGALDCYWAVTDGTTTAINEGDSINTGQYQYFMEEPTGYYMTHLSPLMLSRRVYAYWHTSALVGAGKYIYVKGLVQEMAYD